MKCITGRYGCWLMAASCWLLAVGCSSDDTREQRTTGTLQVATYTKAYQDHGVLNRARSVSAGYTEYNPDHDIALGLFVVPDNTELDDQGRDAKLVRFSSGVWHSQVQVVGNENYRIFGYMPRRFPITATIDPGTSNVVLTLDQAEAVMTDDICFVTGVKDGTKDAEGDLLQGRFDYEGKSENNNICLLLDHLYAAINFKFTVDAEYSALRSFKLTSMTLSTPKASVKAVITLTPNTADTDPVTSVTYTTTKDSEGTNTAPFFNNADGVPITDASISNYFCCFVPQEIVSNALTLVCTYDVYDNTGTYKIRENCTAENLLPHLNVARGERMTLNMKVTPTYLYQLADPDLDNPTIKIE